LYLNNKNQSNHPSIPGFEVNRGVETEMGGD
jgi:hypothetical protein